MIFLIHFPPLLILLHILIKHRPILTNMPRILRSPLKYALILRLDCLQRHIRMAQRHRPQIMQTVPAMSQSRVWRFDPIKCQVEHAEAVDLMKVRGVKHPLGWAHTSPSDICGGEEEPLEVGVVAFDRIL
jgi:hypothetical protein